MSLSLSNDIKKSQHYLCDCYGGGGTCRTIALKLTTLYCKRSCMITAVYSCQQATHSTLRAHGSLMAATDSDDQSEVASAPEYSPLTVSSDSSDAPHDDTEHDSDGTKSSCSEEEGCDRLG